MKKIFLFLIPFFIISCATTADKKGQSSKIFNFYIAQNDKEIEALNDEINLKKAPFKIIFNLNKKTGIYINLSYNKAVYDLAVKKAPMNEILEKDGIWMGGAEYEFNKDNNFFLQDDQFKWQYWYYLGNGDNECRFNLVIFNNGIYTCTRIIENFYYNKKDSKINEYPYPKLYIVATYVTHNNNYSNFREIQTEKIILNFIE